MRRVARLSGALLVAVFACAAAIAQPEREAEEAAAKAKLDALRAELAQIAAEQADARGERNEVTQALRDADVALGAVAKEAAAVEADIVAKTAALDALGVDEHALETRLDQQRAAVAALLRSAYVLGRHGELKLVFAPEQVGKIARLLAYHRALQQDRARRIEAIATDLKQLATVRSGIEAARTALEASRDQLVQRNAALAAERGTHEVALATIEAKLTDAKTRAAALGRDEKALVELIKKLQDAIADIPKDLEGSEPFGTRQGRLAWPVAGKVAAGFGSATGDGRTLEGVLIAAKTGESVKAVSHGRIAYADWLKGYGLLAIVDHGDGFMTLYAHNESLLKDVGEWVSPGDAIATVGASGGSAEPGVYFELRRDGRPVDPVGWLARR